MSEADVIWHERSEDDRVEKLDALRALNNLRHILRCQTPTSSTRPLIP